MSQVQIDRGEDQDIQRMRIEIAETRRKRQLQKERRRRKKMLIRIMSLMSIIVIVGVVAFLAYVIHKNNADRNISLPENDVALSAGSADKEKEASSKIKRSKAAQSKANAFEEIYYCESDKLERYAAYQAQNPDMSPEDVVWRVNSNLDKPWYEYDVPTSGYDDPYIIVNKYNKVSEDYCPPDLVNVDGYKMREETGQAYLELKKAAAAEGLKIRAVSAYRTVEYQAGLYNRYLSTDSKENVDRYSARPGYSEHHTGMAIDLFGSTEGLRAFVNTPEYPWVRDNCYKYGFIIRYTTDIENITGYEDEPWHIRYVGVDVSTDMKEKGIASFEEYHSKYIAHKPSDN